VTKKPLLASIALTAALAGGGIAGFLLGVPGVSQAQTTTVPTDPPTTAPSPAPAPDDSTPPRDGRNCPHHGGRPGSPDQGGSGTSGTSGSSSATNTAYM
jgi:hypothetical protein